jgi:hypothetical protein
LPAEAIGMGSIGALAGAWFSQRLDLLRGGSDESG